MTQLVIKVRGEVLSSNFDEWKLDLIAQIQAVNTELTTEDQFARAQTDVKNFKTAEQALKKAKESAISQASEIQRLFSAIDDVSGEVRQARLSLERQIKQRKAEIKEESVNLGVANIGKYIQLQGSDFQLIKHSEYLDRGIFEEAIKYRSNINALHGAIDDACGRIKTRIDERAALVKANAVKLDSLTGAHRALFQDRSELLSLDANQLHDVIDQRIVVFDQQFGDADSKQEPEPPVPDEEDVSPSAAPETRSAYTLKIELSATLAEAEDFSRTLRGAYAANPLVRTFQLEKV